MEESEGSEEGHEVVVEAEKREIDSTSLVVIPPHGSDANDISKGIEKVGISWTNDSNSASLARSFNYICENTFSQNANLQISLAGTGDEDCCSTCSDDCILSPSSCACTNVTRGEFAYTSEGLVKEKFLDECISMNRNPGQHHLYVGKEYPLRRSKEEFFDPCKGHTPRRFIKECESKCQCSKQCGNRVVQQGIACKLQVFLTSEGKGWGLRTLDGLPKGAFVCEYVGHVLTNREFSKDNKQRTDEEKNMYSVLLDAVWGSEGIPENEEALWLDATCDGNVARFINHRCFDSNMVGIPVKVESGDHYHLAFFTTRKVDASEELTWDYGIDFDVDNPHVKAFQCLCGSKCCRGKKQSHNSSDLDFGTANIASIFGGDIYIAVDSRLTNGDIISNDNYPKLIHYGPDLFGTMCGSRQLSTALENKLRGYIKENEKVTVEQIAQEATTFLYEESIKAKPVGDVPKKIGEQPHEEGEMYEQWKLINAEWFKWNENHLKWVIKYENTCSFICGFEGEIPKVFAVRATYRVPLDISLNYSVEQTNNVITREIANSVEQMDTPNHHVLGSARPLIRKYIEEYDFFKRVQKDCDEAREKNVQNTFGFERNFTKDGLEFAKTITWGSMHDRFTGGHIVVAKISKGEMHIKMHLDCAKVYLEHIYLEDAVDAENRHAILFFIKVADYDNFMYESLVNRLVLFKCVNTKPKIMRLGIYKNLYVYRLPMVKNVDMFLKRLVKNCKTKGDFGLTVIPVGKNQGSWLVGLPTPDVVKPILA